MGDGRVRHVHANKMRKFHVRVQSCNIISENDVDFGRVLVPAIFLPDIGRPYVMHTDASGFAVAAALGQVHDGKIERPMAFAS